MQLNKFVILGIIKTLDYASGAVIASAIKVANTPVIKLWCIPVHYFPFTDLDHLIHVQQARVNR